MTLGGFFDVRMLSVTSDSLDILSGTTSAEENGGNWFTHNLPGVPEVGICDACLGIRLFEKDR